VERPEGDAATHAASDHEQTKPTPPASAPADPGPEAPDPAREVADPASVPVLRPPMEEKNETASWGRGQEVRKRGCACGRSLFEPWTAGRRRHSQMSSSGGRGALTGVALGGGGRCRPRVAPEGDDAAGSGLS
jgi:hypothetical protein